MEKQPCYVPVLAHWSRSDDVLLKALVANGGELYSAVEAVKGQVGIEDGKATAIWLQNSRITDDGIEALASLIEVTEFETSQRMTDASFVHLRGMVKMERLTLLKMGVTGDGLRHLAGMSRLRSLQICSCTLTDAALSHLPVLPALTMFNLSSSTGCTDAALECLGRLQNLEHFSLNGAPATGPGLRHLAELPHLRSLDLSGGSTRITSDDDFGQLPTLPTVEYLTLGHTYITDAGLVYLTRLPGVKSLSLEMTDISDAGIVYLGALPNLESVNLNHTKVTLRGVQELKGARPGLNVSARDCTGGPPAAPEVLELIRRPEHREAAHVARSWARIEAWLAEHLPAALATLCPPVADADLDALETRIGKRLPADFRASYLIHDGQLCLDDDSDRLGVLLGLILEPIKKGESVLGLYEHRVQHDTNGRKRTTGCSIGRSTRPTPCARPGAAPVGCRSTGTLGATSSVSILIPAPTALSAR